MKFEGGPMLAEKAEDLGALKYPLYASNKMDGIRAVITSDGPKTRSLKDIPNLFVRAALATLPVGLDGEIGVIKDGQVDFRSTSSGVMTRKWEPVFKFFVFDYVTDPSEPFMVRHARLLALKADLPIWVEVIEQQSVHTEGQVREMFKQALDEGHEGLILRGIHSAYKFGRSTLSEHGMLKVKPWDDTEARIIEVLPEFKNTNPSMTDEVGRSKRSHHKAGMVQKESMGKLVVQDPRWPKPFEVGTGFSAKERAELWERRAELVGKMCKFQYVTVGGYDVPRHCSYLGIRDLRDMS